MTATEQASSMFQSFTAPDSDFSWLEPCQAVFSTVKSSWLRINETLRAPDLTVRLTGIFAVLLAVGLVTFWLTKFFTISREQRVELLKARRIGQLRSHNRLLHPEQNQSENMSPQERAVREAHADTRLRAMQQRQVEHATRSVTD